MASVQPRSFADLLRYHRVAAGLTQEELAEQSGVSARAICALEIGERRSPHKTTIALLAEALSLTSAEAAQLTAAARQRLPAVINPDGVSSRLPSDILRVQRGERPPVGRARELSALARHLDQPGPPFLLLTGEPGIGKSRLLRECARRAAEQGWTLAVGGCHRRSGQEPYEPFVGALLHFLSTRTPAQQRMDLQSCAWLVRLLPELADMEVGPAPSWVLPPEQERRLMFGAVGRFLANIAGPSGTLLVLDDLQWAGSDALDLLAFLLRESTHRPLRVVAALRDTDVGPRDTVSLLLGDLTRDGLATRMPLLPLDRHAARDLLSTLLAGEPSDLDRQQQQLDVVLDRAGGIPLFLVSYAQEVRAHVDAEGVANRSVGVPGSAVESIRQRWALLPAAAQEVLAVAAVAGRSISRLVLIAAAKASLDDETTVLAGLDAACHARLLAEAPDGTYLFPHDLIREAVESMLGGARRAALHRRIAVALEALPRTEDYAAALAWHWMEGDELPLALPYILRAGDQAASLYAYSDAEHSYAEAVRIARACGNQTLEAKACERRADVHYYQGRFAEAISDLDSAAAIYRELGDWEGVIWSATQRAKASDPFGHVAESLAHIEAIAPTLAALAAAQNEAQPSVAAPASLAEQMELATILLAPRTAARLYLCLASRMVLLGRWDEAAWTSDRAEAYATMAESEETREPRRPLGMERSIVLRSLALSFRAAAMLAQGRLREAALTLEAAVRLAHECRDLDALGMALGTLANVHERQAELGRAKAPLIEMLSIARACEAVRYVAEMECRLGALTLIEGDWAGARHHFNATLRESGIIGAPEAGAVATYANSAMISLAWLDILQGHDNSNESAALAVLRRTLESDAADEPRLLATKALAEHALVGGNAADADAALRTILDGPLRHAQRAIALLTLQAWAELQLGAPERAEKLLREAAARADACQDGLAHLDVLHVQALLAIHERQWEKAKHTVALLLQRCRAVSYPWLEAKALSAYGQLQLAQGNPSEARKTYERAHALCAQLGERLYAVRIERALAGVSEPH